ncbi:MAG TPA: ABC transporter substrate-binding protein [Nannocystaceae bacterium]|nr:ABC transporter substrate-binding protein [Nannocystaceae bacterium]
MRDAVQRSRPSRARGRSLAPVASVAIAALFGCSATALRPRACTSSGECRAAFGLGSVCGDGGYCEPPQQHPRCSEAFPPELLLEPEAYADHVVIGSMFGFVDHRDTLRAAELAIRQLEREKVGDDLAFAMLHCDTTEMAGDDATDLEASAAVATFLAEVVGVPAIVGPRGSARTEAAFAAIHDAGVLLISPSATSPTLGELDRLDPTFEAPGLLWRTVPPDTLQATVIATDMRARGVANVAVIYQAGPYGDGLTRLFETRFTALGGGPLDKHTFENGQFSPIVAKVAESLTAGDVDEVLFLSSDIMDYVAFLHAAVATDELLAAYTGDGVGIFLADAAYNTTLIASTWERSAELYPRVRGTRPAPAEGVLFNTFAAAYSAEYDEDANSSGFTPHSYDAAWLVAYGVAWAKLVEGEIDGVGIARGLRRITGGDPVEIEPTSWPVVLDRFAHETPIDVEGASGPLDYNPDTEETSAPIELWSIAQDPEADYGWTFDALARIDPG